MKLDLSKDVEGLVSSRLKESLEGEKIVLALRSRLELAAVAYVPPFKGHVVGGATTAKEADELLKETFASLLITDDVLEAGDGMALAREHRHLKTLVLSSRENSALIEEAESAAVDGLIFRSTIGLGGEGSFLRALETVASGGVYTSPAVTCLAGSADREALDLIAELTPTERRVLTHVSKGLDNQQIAEEMVVSEQTVKSHLRSLRTTLGPAYQDRIQLCLLGIRAGLN